MSSEPTDIDTSPLDEIAKVGSEQAGLRDLIDKAKAFRDRSVEVCERVIRDYQKRIDALDEQARQLKEKARTDLQTVAARYEEARRGVDKARFDQQEIDFRYEIGEVPRDEYPERRKAADEALARAEVNFANVDALKHRFMDALIDVQPTPEMLASLPKADALPAGGGTERRPEPVQPPRVPPDQPAVAVPPRGEMGTMTFLPTAAAPLAGGAPREPKTERIKLQTAPMPPEPAPASAESRPAPAAEDGATVAIAPAVLHDEEATGAIHQLSFITTIGRTPDNQIPVAEAEVSRHHARISLTDAGFVLEDLKSGNGTFLNGVRITGEQLLKDEDRIRIGSRTFVFRVQ